MREKKAMLYAERTARMDAILSRKQPTLKLLLDNVHSSQNLSAILRSAEGVGMLDLYYSTAENKALRIHKTITQGAHRWVAPLRIDTQARIDFLRQKQAEGYQVIVTHLAEETVSFRDVDYTEPTVIVMGNEKDGVSPEIVSLADRVVAIPMMGMVQSLNVSVAAALLLYEAQRQLQEAGRYDAPQLSFTEREALKEAWLYRDLIARRSKGTIPLK